MKYSLALLLFVFCFCNFSFVNAQQYNPVANPGAVVVSGNARFTVLTDRVIRMEYADSAKFNNQASLTIVNRHLPVPAFKASHANGNLIITTAFLELVYKENSGPFNKNNLGIAYKDATQNFTWRPGTKDHKNLKGTTRTLDGVLGKFSFYSLKKLPVEDGILSRSGWCFIDDSKRPLFDNSDWPWVEARPNYNVQDWYFFGYGTNYKAALYDFVSISGKISMPPKFAFGIWYSRYWKYTEQDMKDIVAGYEKNNIPLDVLVVDMDWHLTESSSPEIFHQYTPKLNGWTGFTWEKKYFPDYKEFLHWTNEKNIQTCLNLHPAAGVQPHEQAYAAFAKAMGVDTTGHPTIPFDITNKKFAENYFNILLHPYEKDGVDFWWLDWQQWGHTNIKGVNPTFYLNYVHFSDMQREGKRPLIFHRYGGLGNQRYQIGFSGDCIIDWRSLTYQPQFTATASNVGFGYWSHDIGGHMNPISLKNKQNPELYTRWVQWGAFSPIFRTHATADPTIERRIWKYPEPNFDAMRKAMQLRYSLVPYIYSYARFAYDSGISLIRPMYYEYPELDKAYHLEQQYFFGADMIVAPIHESMKGKNSISVKVWLPEGNWYDFRNNQLVQGGKTIAQNYALNEIPVFVKAGSIIPTQTPKLRLTGSVPDTLILTVYPAQQASFSLYEDDGSTEAYRNNVFSKTNFAFENHENEMLFKIMPDSKEFTGQPQQRSFEIKIVDSKPVKSVSLNGQVLRQGTDWNYDPASKVLQVNTAHIQIHQQVTVAIEL
ncbi:MAG TPA: TIM-barrel domain-containing protein [Chitinophagales bacterium]|nr:TIM-barrel domain-containing protein [Chitinophagales bacterium]